MQQDIIFYDAIPLIAADINLCDFFKFCLAAFKPLASKNAALIK